MIPGITPIGLTDNTGVHAQHAGSSTTVVGLSGNAYGQGIAVFNYEWMAAIVLVTIAAFFLPAFLRARVFTIPELECTEFVILNKIGCFVSSVGWDTVDVLRMRGYLTNIRHDLAIHYMRRMGTRQGYINGMIRDGRNNHLTGYAPWFFILRALFNIRYYPYFSRLPRAVTLEEYTYHSWLNKSRLLGKNIDTYYSEK